MIVLAITTEQKCYCCQYCIFLCFIIFFALCYRFLSKNPENVKIHFGTQDLRTKTKGNFKFGEGLLNEYS